MREGGGARGGKLPVPPENLREIRKHPGLVFQNPGNPVAYALRPSGHGPRPRNYGFSEEISVRADDKAVRTGIAGCGTGWCTSSPPVKSGWRRRQACWQRSRPSCCDLHPLRIWMRKPVWPDCAKVCRLSSAICLSPRRSAPASYFQTAESRREIAPGRSCGKARNCRTPEALLEKYPHRPFTGLCAAAAFNSPAINALRLRKLASPSAKSVRNSERLAFSNRARSIP